MATLQATMAELRAMITRVEERVRDVEARSELHSGNSSRRASEASCGARGVSALSPGVAHGYPAPCCRMRGMDLSPTWSGSTLRPCPALPCPYICLLIISILY